VIKITSSIAREFFSGAGQDGAPAEDAASGDGGDLAQGDGFSTGDFEV
jgi:hypothetical protein